MANAALTGSQISVNGSLGVDEITLEISDTIVIDVHVTAAQEGIGYIIVQDPGAGGIWYDDDAGGNVAGQYAVSYPGYPGVYAGAGDYPGSTGRYSYAGWGFGYEFTVAGGVPTPDLPGGLAFDYLFHCEGEGTVVIELWEDPDYTNVADTLTITQIPEPMTVALLGLGGLLLRRRK